MCKKSTSIYLLSAIVLELREVKHPADFALRNFAYLIHSLVEEEKKSLAHEAHE